MQMAWAEHKHAHNPGPHTWAYVTQRGRGRSFTLPTFAWPGSLRPDRVAPRREVLAKLNFLLLAVCLCPMPQST